MTKILDRIIKNRLPSYFISPHLDDAALSAGCLMRYLAKRGVPVTVVNVFTAADSRPQTLSARSFVKKSGYATAESLFAARRAEDAHALGQIKVRVINLDYTDAPWRRRPTLAWWAKLVEPLVPEVAHLYPIHRLHIASGKISPLDHQLVMALSRDLSKIITSPQAVVFCPEAIGGHVDHALVKLAVSMRYSPVRWLDQPYSLTRPPVISHAAHFTIQQQIWSNNGDCV